MPQTVLMSDRPSASRAGDLLLLSVAAGAFWTLSYQFVLILRWPAKTIIWCFLLIAIAGFLLLGRLWRKTNATPGRGYRFHLSQVLLVALGLLCAITVLFVRRPNQDDVVYFHRALSQLSALDQPIFLRQTSVDMDAAAFSPVHLATSFEMLMAFLGHYLGIDPLYFYQIIGHALAAFATPFIFYWCVRRFGLNRWPAAVGALLGIGFLLLDSAGPASFGNVVLGKMWQGKAIVWILFLPIALSLTYRFLCGGNRSDFVWLVLLAIAGVGQSSTALYLVPAVIGCSCLSFLGVEALDPRGRDHFWRQLRRCLLLAVPLAYPVTMLALLKFNVIPKQIDLRGFGPKYVPWREGMGYVVGGPAEHMRNIVLMVAIPLLIVGGKRGLFVFFYICGVWLFCLNPLLSHRWM